VATDGGVNGLELLANHIGKLAGKLPSLKAGDRWKLARQQSIMDKEQKQRPKMDDDDWE